MTQETQSAFRALADPTRRQILLQLRSADMSIGEVADHFPMTRAAVKKHLGILEEGNLISVSVKGRERINKLEPEGIKAVADWITFFSGFWDSKLSNLQSALNKHQPEDQTNDE